MELHLPDHHLRFVTNIEEVLRLIEIHENITGTGPGYRHNVQVLNKSAIIFLVACWESYVEDLCEAALNFMINNAQSYSVFPRNVLDRVSSKHQGPKAWELAGDGWKDALKSNKKEILARTTDKLNTPAVDQVRDLFFKTIGLNNLPSTWHWRGKTEKESAIHLDKLIRLRGSIAHKVETSRPVRKSEVIDHLGFVRYLAVKSTNNIRLYIHEKTGQYPWRGVKRGKVK